MIAKDTTSAIEMDLSRNDTGVVYWPIVWREICDMLVVSLEGILLPSQRTGQLNEGRSVSNTGTCHGMGELSRWRMYWPIDWIQIRG